MVPALAGSLISLLMVTTMSAMNDKVFERLLQHRDSILRQHRWLAGDEVSPTLAADAWQINAGNLALELRKYASLLDAISAGLLTGPIVFPSWDEGRQDGPFGVIADAHKDGCTNPAVFNCCEDAYRMAKAAPELLAALKDLMELYANGQVVIEGNDGNDPVVGAAWDAIAKAEGGAE